MIDAAEVRKTVVEFIESLGFVPRDADGADFARPQTSIRFKVGTSRGEVAISVWKGPKQVDIFRVVSDESLRDALDYIDGFSEVW